MPGLLLQLEQINNKCEKNKPHFPKMLTVYDPKDREKQASSPMTLQGQESGLNFI